MSTRNRADAALRHILDAMEAGLAAKIATVNADLADEGVTWELPAVTDITLVAQALHPPDTTPRVRIAAGLSTGSPITVGSAGEQTLPVEVFALLGSGDLDVSDEGDLVQAALALGDACWWAVNATLKEAPGHLKTSDYRAQAVLMDLDDADAGIAVECRITFNITLRKPWRLT